MTCKFQIAVNVMDVHLLQNNFCFNNNFDACGYPKLYRSMGT